MRIIFKDKTIAKEAADQLSAMGLVVALSEIFKKNNLAMRFWQLQYKDRPLKSKKAIGGLC